MGNLDEATASVVGNLRDIVDLAVGAVVVLKSGGPKMTVTYASANDHVSCYWFSSDHLGHNQTFPAEALQECEIEHKGET